MISKELAQERLKIFRNPNSSIEQVARLEKLSANLSILGQILIQAGPEWEQLQKDQKRSESRKYSVEQIKNSLAATHKSLYLGSGFDGGDIFVMGKLTKSGLT